MKKIIVSFALLVGMTAVADVEVYQFKSSIKIPVLAGNAKSGFYRNYVGTTMNGWLTVDSETVSNETAVITATIAKTKETVRIPLDQDIVAVLAGKKQNVSAAHFSGTDDDGKVQITCAGIGSTKVKTTGCTPCGIGTTCTRTIKLSGNLVGLYDCGCYVDQYATIDDVCNVDYTTDTDIAPIYGTWSITLKTVDGAKY